MPRALGHRGVPSHMGWVFCRRNQALPMSISSSTGQIKQQINGLSMCYWSMAILLSLTDINNDCHWS